MVKVIENIFSIKSSGSNIKQEIIGGFTTFITMSYIIFVQPAVLSACGMDKDAVIIATCLGSAIATILMAFLANYPIALAPGMGHNFYFAYVICLGMGISWPVALGANFISGALFIILAFFGLREKLINAVPSSLKNAIAVGIGLLIALIGLEWSGLIVQAPGTLIGLGDIKSSYVLLSLFGITVISILMSLKVKGAILIGIIINTAVALSSGMAQFHGIIGRPSSITPTFLKLDIIGALNINMIGVIFTLFFLDLFDTVGTLIGVSQEAGFIKEGKLPKARGALLSDAVGTVVGTCLGTSTITSYIESSTGIAQGART
ncbi:MAG: NCS2 family permease, partial [Candidatus Omnitrophota bacterium]